MPHPTREPLTRRQHEVLEFITRFVSSRGLAPTLEEIAEELGIHRVTALEHLRQLQTKGWLNTTPHRSRSIVLTGGSPRDRAATEIPFLGTIAAGRPIEAVVDPETFDLANLLPTGEECFLLRVRGNSMIEDQIRDGDLVVVAKRSQARDGETVVALLHRTETTLKVLQRHGDTIRLLPRNSELSPIEVAASDVEIQGVVVAVLRSYGRPALR